MYVMYKKFPVFKNRNVQKVYHSTPELQRSFTAGEKLEIQIATMWMEEGYEPVAIAQHTKIRIQEIGRIINACENCFKAYEKGIKLSEIADFYSISMHLAFYYILMGIQNKINEMLGEQMLNIVETSEN